MYGQLGLRISIGVKVSHAHSRSALQRTPKNATANFPARSSGQQRTSPSFVANSHGGYGRRCIWQEVVETAQSWQKGSSEVQDTGWLSPARCD
jgi:hypothetical protein